MTVDHVNKYLFNATLPYAFEMGRVALPIFLFVLAYNLARPRAMECGLYGRITARLGAFGALASLPFIALGGLMWGWWPLNILFTLAVTVGVILLLKRGGAANLLLATLVFAAGGLLVEYWWPAICLGVALWLYCGRPSLPRLALVVACLAALTAVNGNLWALAALPILTLAHRIEVACPRARWFFYAYYPLHLAAIWMIRIPMRHAGYLFFT